MLLVHGWGGAVGRRRLGWLLLLLGCLAWSPDLRAQAASAVTSPDGEEVAALAEDPADEAADDLDTLVAPVALYPDPLLAAVLQATVMPLDVVNAAQFLRDFETDETLRPDPEWDPAVRALLGFPVILQAMDEHLDWVEAMGDAVLERLPDVQESIQQVRSEFHAAGMLATNEQQKVIVDKDVIRIEPADPQDMHLPVYDPAALVEAVEAGDPALATQAAEVPAPGEAESDAVAEAQAAAEAAQQSAATAEQAATAATESASQAEEAAVAAQTEPPAEEVAAASPVTEPAPATAAAPVSYAAPAAYPAQGDSSSTWSTVGTFAGGALVGGILGYALSDDEDGGDGWFDDDDDYDDFWDDADDFADENREERQDYLDERQDEREQRLDEAQDRREEQRQQVTERRQEQQQQVQERRAQRSEDLATAQADRQKRSAETKAKLGDRAQKSAAQKKQLANRREPRAAPSPNVKLAAASPEARRPVPKLEKAGARKAVKPGTASLPRQAGAKTAARPKATARVGDSRATATKSAALDVKRGSTVKKEQARGAKSRVKAAPQRQQTAKAPAQRRQVAAATSRPKSANKGVSGGGRKAATHGKRGAKSRKR